MKKNKNTESTAAEYAAVRIVKMLVDAVNYQPEQELDELVKAHPALGSISASEIEYILFSCAGLSREDVREEISFLASKVRKENFALGTAIMVVLEKGIWGELYSGGTEWHFSMPATAECCREMHAARKRLHAKVCRPYIPYIADDDWDPEDYWDLEWDN